MNRVISKHAARAMVLEYFRLVTIAEPKKLDDLLCAALRVERLEYPLYLTEMELRAKLESTRALFADTFRVRV